MNASCARADIILTGIHALLPDRTGGRFAGSELQRRPSAGVPTVDETVDEIEPWARRARPGQAQLDGRVRSVGFRSQDAKPDGAFAPPGTSVCSAAMVELETPRTKTDSAGLNGWSICDEVTRLREWGTDIVYPLPSKRETSIIGAAGDCWLRLWDPTGRISRRHAALSYGGDGWSISDLQSKNGVHFDGARVASLSLVPGAEIRIGPVTLIAESPKLIALRQLIERIIGWGEERREEVDQALFSIRIAATHREPLL